MNTFRFLQWEMYVSSQELTTQILQIVKDIPREYRYEIGSQIIRSSFSIPLNIAEGCAKQSDKELNRFLEIAIGSAYETLAGIDTLHRNNLVSKDEFENIQNRIQSISKQIGGFKKKLQI